MQTQTGKHYYTREEYLALEVSSRIQKRIPRWRNSANGRGCN
ncbi:hypothetical protein [Nostoc sp. NMS7]